MNRTKQVNEMFDLLQRECHKTLNNAKNSKKGGFSEEIEENYSLLLQEVSELIEAMDAKDYVHAFSEITDVVNFCAALMLAIKKAPKEETSLPVKEAEDWC